MEGKEFDLFYCVDGSQAIVFDGAAQNEIWQFLQEKLDEVVTFNTGAEDWSQGLGLSELEAGEDPPPWGQVGQYGKCGCVVNDAREGWQGDRAVWVTLLPYDESPRGLLAFLRELEESSNVRFGSSFLSSSDCDRFGTHFVFNPEEDQASLEARGDAIPSSELLDEVFSWGQDHAKRLPAPDGIDVETLSDEAVESFGRERATEEPCRVCFGEGSDPNDGGVCRSCWGTGKDVLDSDEIDLTDFDLRDIGFEEEVDFMGARLVRANLAGVDLGYVYLKGADLSEAMLEGANLEEVTLSEAKLNRANLKNAKLREADLSGADLSGADLSGADLSFATLDSTNLDGASLEGAVLDDADFTDANLLNTQPETARSISGTNLVGVSGLTDSQLEQCQVAGAVLDSPSPPVVPTAIEGEEFWKEKKYGANGWARQWAEGRVMCPLPL